MDNRDLNLIAALMISVISTIAALCAKNRKGLSGIWVFLTFLFPPIFLIVELLPSKNKHIATLISCSLCHKDISSKVKKCPHCGHTMPRKYSLIGVIYEIIISILWVLMIIFMIIGVILESNLINFQKPLLKNDLTLNEPCGNGSDNSFSTQKSCHLQAKGGIQQINNNIVIPPLDMYINKYPNTIYAPTLDIVYQNIVQFLNIHVSKQKLEFWIILEQRNEYPDTISAKLNNQLIQFTHVNDVLYKYIISEKDTKQFVHDFTSAQSIQLNIDGQKINLSLSGSTKIFNNFIKNIEEKHISLPPPFKYFEDSPLNNQEIENIIKPNQREISNISIQKALNTLNQVDCSNIAQNLVNIVSSCYNDIHDTNEKIDICLAEDELAGYWLAFTKSKKELLKYNDFFSEKKFSLRKEKYMFSRFDSILASSYYYDPLYKKENDLLDILNKRCIIN